MKCVLEQASARLCTTILAGVLLSLAGPSTASAQSSRPDPGPRPALAANYRIEVGYAWWKPDLFGSVSSDRLDLIGSHLDLVDDLGFGSARFKDLRFTLRPARAHKIRFQYTPLDYVSSSILKRQIVFAGHTFDAELPVDSELGWKVWRFGYEWDFISKSRGFMGVLLEARKTQLTAELTSLAASGQLEAQAPLPAIGVVTRAYPLPDLGLTFEISGFRMPETNDNSGTYTDMELSATVDVTKGLGLSVGWRRLETDIRIKRDFGDLRFQGIWFGGVIRY